MRVCKLSDKVFGFDSLEGCKAYFKHVLPWSKYYFPIVGEGNRISKDKISKNESILFSYNGNIVAIAKLNDIELADGKVASLILSEEALKVFGKLVGVTELEHQLSLNGYKSIINQSEGWNIIPEEYEFIVIDFLIKHEWELFLEN